MGGRGIIATQIQIAFSAAEFGPDFGGGGMLAWVPALGAHEKPQEPVPSVTLKAP